MVGNICRDYWHHIYSFLHSQSNQQQLIPTVVFLLWHIWKSWNALIFRNQILHPQQVIVLALNHLEDFTSAYSVSSMDSVLASEPQGWSSPPEGILKINFDAAFSSHNNSGAIAAICRDHLNNVIGWLCKRLNVVLNPLVVETLAGREKPSVGLITEVFIMFGLKGMLF
ncbi:uncharacterized protein LOC131178805 [Hevea brasiliensis]|uniref:uncharacterized protein LOC131178805 n=1 Tax=Hevea brasiliensis TaxID=3981 RepID=UPI0025D52D00|nr:uncharacterized protein LOC131178805 [Hevea brasiliensis]